MALPDNKVDRIEDQYVADLDGNTTIRVTTGSGSKVDINDISKGVQTKDVKVSLNGEIATITGTVSIGDITSATQTNDVKVTLDNELVILGTSTNIIGNLGTSVSTIGNVTLNPSSVEIGTVTLNNSSASVGTVTVGNEITLTDSSASIGTVTLNSSSASIGSVTVENQVILGTSTNIIGNLGTSSSEIGKVIITDSTTDVNVDSVKGGIQIITTPHKEIHNGDYYHISKNFLSVADNAFADMRILTGSTPLHLTAEITAEGKAYLSVHKDSTYTGTGSPLMVFNRNGTSSNTSSIVNAGYTPTINVLAGTAYETIIPAGLKKNAVGGVRSNAEEWILDTDSDYLLRAQNKGGDTKDIAIEAEWYE